MGRAFLYGENEKKICLGQEYSPPKTLIIYLWKLNITSLCDSFPFWRWENLGLAGGLEVLINNPLELLATCLGVSDYCCYRNSPGWLCCFSFSHICKTLVFNFIFLFLSFRSLLHLEQLLHFCSTLTQWIAQLYKQLSLQITSIIKRVCRMPCQLAKLTTQFFYSSLGSS